MPSPKDSAACWKMRRRPQRGALLPVLSAEPAEKQAHRRGHEHTTAVRASSRAAARPRQPTRLPAPGCSVKPPANRTTSGLAAPKH